MPRQVNITLCSSCLNEFPTKEMFTVGRAGYHLEPDKVTYYTLYCKKCTKNDTESYVKIIKEPVPPKKRKTKKK